MTGQGGRSTLLEGFRRIVDERGHHPAVREPGKTTTYEELAAWAGALRARLDLGPRAERGPVGILLSRSAEAYGAMWAAVATGRAYVPLNPTYPATRLGEIASQAGITDLVCCHATTDLAARVRADHEPILVDELRVRPEDADRLWQAADAQDIAYMLFTSGSTGVPKGVPISYDSLAAFVDNLRTLLPYRPDDVCSQVCELSFDFSVHEIYLALLSGSTLCPAQPTDLFNPARYVASNGITVWISVPSLARVTLNNGLPVGEQLSGLRLSVFNGEALTVPLARAWLAAAPNTTIWNNYGPTECTVAVTAQRWSDEPDLAEADVVSIGRPFPDCEAAILDNGVPIPTREAPDGLSGELVLSGPQRFDGYLDPRLPSPFVDGRGHRWYRTGDRVRWRTGRLYHLGRLDHQVKVGGHRIELLEVEHRLRGALDLEALAVIAHPEVQPSELVLFVEGDEPRHPVTPDATGLPGYMVPKRIIAIEQLPVNTNGKLDRSALHALAARP